MKTINILIAIFAILLLIIFCSLLADTKNNLTAVSAIVDITDSLTVKPNTKEIKSLFNLNEKKWEGVDFRLLYITNVSYNPNYEANIEPENQWLSNQFQRNEKIKNFYADIDKIINDTSNESIGKDNSTVYFPIAEELNRLSQSKATTKEMFIYSDLMENTDELSFYDKNTFKLLKDKPDKIKNYFDSQITLNNLSGIKIYLIYQPTNTKQDDDYKVVSGFYEILFQSKGATVEITANTN